MWTLIDASSGYHNLKCDKKSSYLTMIACQFGGYRITRLLFRVALAGDTFQQKIDEIFKGLPSIFSTAKDSLIVGYDADDRDHDKNLSLVTQICWQGNLKLNKTKFYFRCTRIPFLEKYLQKWSTTKSPKTDQNATPMNKLDSYPHE